MKNRISRLLVSLVVVACLSLGCADAKHGGTKEITSESTEAAQIKVPLAGNAFVTNVGPSRSRLIHSTGLTNWEDKNSVISVFFRVTETGKLNLNLRGKSVADAESSTIKVSIEGQSKEINLSSTTFQDISVGTFDVSEGYVKVDLQGVTKEGQYFGEISDLLIDGEAVLAGVLFSDDPSYYYWARRGPSCHMGYTIPTSEEIEYYYGELHVPDGDDPIGSYFMSNGFSEGYFGIQVNSENERRILFSVWSPYSTDDPKEIPEHLRITLNKKGEDVHTGEFGNEGSGGQSFMKYNWKAGQDYKFLLRGHPDGKGATDFTAWIYLEDKAGWTLIASWKRPEMSKYLTGFHSFLENFNPEQGHLGRKVYFSNRWVRTVGGDWKTISSAKFTVDATYNAKQRIDAIGGVEGDRFFLQNGGFFSTVVEPGSLFELSQPKSAPVIDFDKLP